MVIKIQSLIRNDKFIYIKELVIILLFSDDEEKLVMQVCCKNGSKLRSC